MSNLIVDTNLLVLLIVGLASKKYISAHKKLSAYDVKDFEILSEIISKFDQLVFTPHVLSETSNLVACINEPAKTEIMKTFGEIIGKFGEQYVPSVEGIGRAEFTRLGLTDGVLLTLGQGGGSLITADVPLYLAATSAGYQATNYMHIKGGRADFN